MWTGSVGVCVGGDSADDNAGGVAIRSSGMDPVRAASRFPSAIIFGDVIESIIAIVSIPLLKRSGRCLETRVINHKVTWGEQK